MPPLSLGHLPLIVVDVGSGTGIFTRQLRVALPDDIRIVGIEPSPSMRAQAVAETADGAGVALSDGVAEQRPFGGEAARAIAAATLAHWFDRPAFYRETRRVLVPGGAIAIVEYVRDQAGSPLADALIGFMAQYGWQKAYAPADYRREIAGAAGFHDAEAFVLRCQLRLDMAALTGLALSSSHAADVIERFGIDGAPSALRGWRRRTGSMRVTCCSATFFSLSQRAAMRGRHRNEGCCARHPRMSKLGDCS